MGDSEEEAAEVAEALVVAVAADSGVNLAGKHLYRDQTGKGGAASSALSLDVDDVPASTAASLRASEATALGAYVTVISKGNTQCRTRERRLDGPALILKLLRRLSRNNLDG